VDTTVVETVDDTTRTPFLTGATELQVQRVDDTAQDDEIQVGSKQGCRAKIVAGILVAKREGIVH
jgi:hypothetical protein